MRLVLASLSYVQITPPKPFLIVIRLYSVHKKLIFRFDKCLVLWFAAGKPSFGGSKLSFGGSKPLFGGVKLSFARAKLSFGGSKPSARRASAARVWSGGEDYVSLRRFI